MKNKIFIFLLLLLVFVFPKCKKNEFEAFDPSAISTSQFYKTQNDAIASVTSCYSAMKYFYFHESGCMAFDALSEDLYYSDFSNPNGTSLDALSYNATNGWVAQAWTKLYLCISRVNIALDKLPGIAMEDNLKARLMAEAKFLRAYMYFILSTAYGDVPLILKPVDISVNSELYPTQTSKADIWTQIEKDLTEAIVVLPTNYAPGDIGRVTKGAAMAYLGKSYLYQKKYAAAAAEFQLVMNLTNVNNSQPAYGLLSNYADNFHGTNEWSKECVLQVNFSKSFPNGSRYWVDGGVATARNMDVGNYGGGWNNERPIQYAVKVHETTDTIRLFESVLGAYKVISPGDTAGSRFDDKPAYTAKINGPLKSWKAMGEKNLGFGKYLYHDSNHSPFSGWDGSAWGNDINYNLMRFADVLLMYAEAVNESGGPTAAAIAAFNQVRSRALMAPYPTYTYAGDYAPVTGSGTTADFRNAIKHERQVEFFNEQIRWFDMVRWGDCESAFAAANAFETTIPNSLAPKPAFDKKDYLFPIPEAERKLNAKLVQNTGW